jgi:hypothetical protein
LRLATLRALLNVEMGFGAWSKTMNTAQFEYAACLLGLGLLVIVVDHWFPILRDIPVDKRLPNVRLPYSLGRVQMALWTVIVVSSIVYVYLTIGNFNGSPIVVDLSIVKLLGISGATGIAAAAVDVSKDKTVESSQASFSGTASAVQSINAQILAALTLRNAAGNRVPAGATVMKLFADKGDKIADLSRQSQTIQRSQRDDVKRGFIADLLTDQNGNSLHRLQLILFTLLYGAYLILHVANASPAEALNVKFPDGVLELMGLTSGVYVGFKVPGKTS